MKTQFVKAMGIVTATSMVVGIIIGTGIFLTAGEIASYIHSPFWILIAWLVGGIIATTGAITMAQLSFLLPHTGGAYIYIREAFGEICAFLYGCVLFIVLQCGSIAAVAVGFSYYFVKLFPSLNQIIILEIYSWQLTMRELISVFFIVMLSAVNYRGARLSSIVQLCLTGVTLLIIVIFITIGFSFQHQTIDFAITNTPSSSHFALALIPILWAFSGWYNLNFAAEEIENSSKTITVSLLLGMFIVTIIYLLVNSVYLQVLPIHLIQGEKEIAYTVMDKLMGSTGAQLISFLVVIAALGTLHGLIFASPRAYFAMAKDGLFPFLKPELHPRFATPHTFIVVQAIWSCALVIMGEGSYKVLFTYVMFCGLLFTALVGVSLLKLKKNQPLPLSWTYPVVPIFFIISSLGLAANVYYYSTKESILGLIVVFVSLPLYFFIKPGANK